MDFYVIILHIVTVVAVIGALWAASWAKRATAEEERERSHSSGWRL